MKRAWLVIALLLSVGINIGLVAAIGLARVRADGPSWSRSSRWDGQLRISRVEDLADRLRLDAEQRPVFLEAHRDFFDSLQSIRRELGETKAMLRREVGSARPNSEKIDELLGETARLNARMERAFVDHVLATRTLLDESQQETYLDLLRRRRDDGERGDRGRRRPTGRHPNAGPPP